MRRRNISRGAGALLLTGSVLAAGAASAGGVAGTAAALPLPVPQYVLASPAVYAHPPTTAQCLKAQGLACYGPPQYHAAYGTGPLYSQGVTGKGETIVIV